MSDTGPESGAKSTETAEPAGKPLIGSRVGGVPQYLRDGVNGLLFESENADDLVEKLRTILSCPDLRARMGKAGYEFAQAHYTSEVFGCVL